MPVVFQLIYMDPNQAANTVVNNLNQTVPQPASPSGKKKVFFVLLGIGVVILIGELVWAYLNFTNQAATSPVQNTQTVPNSAVVNQTNKNGTISLTAPKTTLKVGEKLTVTINASSSGALTDGTDLIITFDPKILTIETVGEDKKPIVVSDVYSEYPSNSLDPTKPGVITASGISSEQNGRAINGVFGSMIFTAKAPGKTTIGINFDPNLTSESNIIETKSGVDILNQVTNLEVVVQ